MYNEESRKLQDQFDSRRLADRLNERLVKPVLSDEDRAFIEKQYMFFLATTDADGFPDCSFKGGAPGFVRVCDPGTIVFPSYDGNGMFKSLGNIRAKPAVALLFVDFEEPDRLRVHGEASVSAEDPLMSEFPGAQLLVRVAVRRVFPNCSRYIPRMRLVEPSCYIPSAGKPTPVPGWKKRPDFREVLPGSDPARHDGE